MCREGTSRPIQTGSVLTEFAVVAGFVLVPLALVLPILFKYIENRQYIEQAARYAAWEKTAYRSSDKDLSEIKKEIDNRIFSTGTSIITAKQKNADHEEEINPNLTIWDRQGRKSSPIFSSISQDDSVEQWADVTVANNGVGGQISQAFSGFGARLLDVGNSNFKLEDKGLYTTEVSVDLKEVPYFEELGDVPIFERSGTLLADGWSQGGPSGAASAARSMNIVNRWGDGDFSEALNDVINLFSYIPFPGFGSLADLDLNRVEVDAVPCVNLGILQDDGAVSPAEECN